MDNIWFIAAIWMGLALVASLVSIRLGISVALVEILVGVVAGNLPIAIMGHRISQFNSTVPPSIASPVMELGRRESVLWSGAFKPTFSRLIGGSTRKIIHAGARIPSRIW